MSYDILFFLFFSYQTWPSYFSTSWFLYLFSFSCCMFHFLTLMLVSFKTFTVQLFILYIFFLFPVYIYFSLSTLTSFFLSRILLFHLPPFLLFWILFFTFFSPFCLLPSFSVSLLLLSARKQDAAEQIPAEFLLLRYTHILTHYLSFNFTLNSSS